MPGQFPTAFVRILCATLIEMTKKAVKTESKDNFACRVSNGMKQKYNGCDSRTTQSKIGHMATNPHGTAQIRQDQALLYSEVMAQYP